MIAKTISAIAIGLALCVAAFGQTKNFTPVEGANQTYVIHVAESEKDLELRKSAIASLGRIAGQKSLGALTSTVDNDVDVELQKQAVIAIGRRQKDEAIPILIRTARNHPKMAVRKLAVQVLGQTGDERAVAFFRELLSKD